MAAVIQDAVARHAAEQAQLKDRSAVHSFADQYFNEAKDLDAQIRAKWAHVLPKT